MVQKHSGTASRKRSRSPESGTSNSELAQKSKRPRTNFLPRQKGRTIGEMQRILDQLLGCEADGVQMLAENRHATEVVRVFGLLDEGQSPRSFDLGGERTE